MSIQQQLLSLVQLVAICTFVIFMMIVFFKKIDSKSSLKQHFLNDKKMLIEFTLFSFFYIYLFNYLFIANQNYSPLVFFVVGSITALAGLILAFIGRLQLKDIWTPITTMRQPMKVVDKGVFRLMRHPIYAGRLLFFTGTMLMLNPVGLLFAFFYWLSLRKKALEEEDFLFKTSPHYKIYAKKVKRIFF